MCIRDRSYVLLVNYQDERYNLNSSTRFNVSLPRCDEGFIINVGKCFRCPKEYFTLDGKNCEYCIPNAKCNGGNEIVLDPGYWRANNKSNLVLKCPIKDSCQEKQNNKTRSLQQTNTTQVDNGICMEGYAGNLCTNCAKNYAKYESGECSFCKKDFFLSLIHI
eukprot:TRINITY_DN5318_c0_g2_i2.p1 TRINITY_DN5318_c0_g2~~TRINITY_DN5318_c0_g2_i2.p1  ORF type:complete len:178 (-),score=11.48 TRINITY_DN5318_c0_g2_i2:42-530(-)